MGEKLAGIARNSCPLCGELVPVHFWSVLPSRTGLHRVQCPACQGHVVVARSTGAMAMVGGLLGGFVGMGVECRFVGLERSGVFVAAAFAGFLLGAVLLGKLVLRLEIEGQD